MMRIFFFGFAIAPQNARRPALLSIRSYRRGLIDESMGLLLVREDALRLRWLLIARRGSSAELLDALEAEARANERRRTRREDERLRAAAGDRLRGRRLVLDVAPADVG